MSHINTIVKVKAKNPKEAVEIVTSLVNCNGDYNAYNTPHSGFDWCDEEAIQVLPKFTEKDFKELRKQELAEYHDYKQRAEDLEVEEDNHMQGYYLEQAGRVLQEEDFWSYDRLAYDLTKYSYDGEGTKGKTFYVETDRHY